MTYRPKDDTDSATGRRLTKVEITPGMIVAGVGPFARFDPAYGPYNEGVSKVVRAVLEAGGYRVTEK